MSGVFKHVLTVAAEVGWLLPFSFQFLTRLAAVFAEEVGNLTLHSFDFGMLPRFYTPLASAVKRGHKGVVELLIAVGADLNTINDTTLETQLDLTKVESWEHPEVKAVKSQIADLLRKHGGKTGEELKAEGK